MDDADDSQNFYYANYANESNKRELLRQDSRLQSESVPLPECGVQEADGASLRGHMWAMHITDKARSSADIK